jgi:hypothetical protein
MRWHVGREMQVVPRGASDRWGRRPVRLVVRPVAALDGEAQDLGQQMIQAGLALVDPAAGDGPCQRALLAIEAAARARGLGLWAGDRYTPIPVAELARLKDQIGRFTLVEGRVRSVGERPQRTYLNFSSDWAGDFTIIVPKRIWSRIGERGFDATSLKGRHIRARGVLEDRQGPAMTIVAPEVIEVIEEERKVLAR